MVPRILLMLGLMWKTIFLFCDLHLADWMDYDHARPASIIQILADVSNVRFFENVKNFRHECNSCQGFDGCKYSIYIPHTKLKPNETKVFKKGLDVSKDSMRLHNYVSQSYEAHIY